MKNNRWKHRNCMKLWQGVSSPSKSVPKAVRNSILCMKPVRRGVAGLTPLRTDDAIQSI